MEMSFDKSKVVSSTILGIALVSGLFLHGWEMSTRSSQNMVTITGSTKRTVTADQATWYVTLDRQAGIDGVPVAMTAMGTDFDKLKKFVTSHGVDEKAITALPINVNPQYNYQNGQTLSGYLVTQQIHVAGTGEADVAKIEQLAKDAGILANNGIITESQRIDYTYSKLADLRPELYADATKDAQTRATAIVKGTGARVGKVKSAKTGVIQVLPPNSTDVADYGAYDMSTKEKEISATVNVSFELLP